MPEQSFKNHAKWDPWFHFLLSPLLLVNLILAVRHMWNYPAYTTVLAVAVAAGLLVLLFLVRIYSLRVQDRVIRLEERLRMERVLPEDLRPRIADVTLRQIVALRFASDAELPELVRRALAENLTGKQIKAAIVTWRPDHLRV